MINSIFILLAIVFSSFCSGILTPHLIKLSYRKDLVDAPNFRKLQRNPVPVIGGICIYVSVLGTLFSVNLFYPTNVLFLPICAISVLFLVGLIDDLVDLSPKSKFFFQILTICILWYVGGYRIDNLGGVLGIEAIPAWISFIFSLIAGVGLINALNLIDGVDGLASGFSICTNAVCGVLFLLHGDFIYALLAFIFVGALLSFFIFNVFSHKYKMFIGDSGSLVLGVVAYIFVCRLLAEPYVLGIDTYRGSFAIAIFAIPVIDTLRVMSARIKHGTSPFHPDRTHLHHIFVDLRFPHVVVTLIILSMGCLIGLFCWVLSLCNISVTLHFLLVMVFAFSLIVGSYLLLDCIRKEKTVLFKIMQDWATNISQKPQWWRVRIGYFIDGRDKYGRMKRAKHLH